MQITAIILTGGKSKRMGTDKALLEIDGSTMLERAITLCESFASETLISSNNAEHEKFAYPLIPDEYKNCGPMSGVYSCLKASSATWNVVISVDSAFVEVDFLQFLIENKGDYDAVVPRSAKGREPLIALYNKSCLPVLANKLRHKDFKMQNFLDAVNLCEVDSKDWEKKYPKLFVNLNRPEDLKIV